MLEPMSKKEIKGEDEEVASPKDSSCSTTISLFWYKAFYMFFIGAFWMKIVYLPLYFKQIGLPAHYAGVLAGISPFLRGAGSFFLGLMTEKPETRKAVLLMSLVAQVITPLMCLIPHPAHATPKGPYLQNDTWVVNMTKIMPLGDPPVDDFRNKMQNCVKWTCLGYQLTMDSPTFPVLSDTNVSTHNANSTTPKSTLLDIDLDIMSTFWIILAIISVGEFLGGPARSLADAATLQALGENKRDFGYVRLWGNVGQLLLTGIIYLMLRFEHVKIDGIEQGNYLFAVIVIVMWMALAFPTALGFACDHSTDPLAEENENQKGKVPDLSDVLGNFHSLSLLVITFCIGMLNGTFNTFMFWFVLDIAGSRANLIITVALALRILYIILAFRVSGLIIRALGVMNVTHGSLMMYCALFVMYGLMKNPWLAIIPEVLQNIIKALTEVAVILFFSEITPFRYAATVQGIIQSFLEGFGFGVGPIIGGFLVYSLGIRTTFFMFGAFAAGVGIFSMCTHAINWIVNRSVQEEQERAYSKLREQEQ